MLNIINYIQKQFKYKINSYKKHNKMKFTIHMYIYKFVPKNYIEGNNRIECNIVV